MTANVIYSANAIPITASNRLRLRFWNSDNNAGYYVIVRWEIQMPDGTISNNAETVRVLNNVGDLAFSFPLTEGNLLSVTLTSYLSILPNGVLWAIIALQYGDVAEEKTILPLTSGYILGNAALNYPLSEPSATNSGVPALQNLVLDDPGVGSDINQSFATYSLIQPTGFNLQLDTDATVATRTPTIIFNGLSGEILRVTAPAGAAGGSSTRFQGFFGTQPATVPANTVYVPMPTMPYIQGLQITTSTANLQVGDQYSVRFLTANQYATQ